MVDEVMNNRTIRFPNSLEKRIEKASDDFSEFVRQACIEKLARKIKEDKSYEEINQFMNEMVALNPKRNIRDLQIKSDFIYLIRRKTSPFKGRI